MRVPPSGSRPLGNTGTTQSESVSTPAKTSFKAATTQAKQPSSAGAAGVADIIADVKALALEVKGGTVSKEEASKRFVSIVIEKRHDLSALGPKAKQVEEAIREIAGDDPSFVARLSTQLQQLAKA